MQKVGSGLFNFHDLRHGSVLKLGKLFEGNKELLIPGKQPDSMFGDVGDFNTRNVFASRKGFHLSASG
jgi:hypothetical protein